MIYDKNKPWGAKPGTVSRDWFKHEIDRLRAMVEGGDGDAEIAAELGRSVRAVAIKRQRLGLTVRDLAKPDRLSSYADSTLVRELRDRGFTVSTTRRVCGTAVTS